MCGERRTQIFDANLESRCTTSDQNRPLMHDLQYGECAVTKIDTLSSLCCAANLCTSYMIPTI
jgi:hypothetical protein